MSGRSRKKPGNHYVKVSLTLPPELARLVEHDALAIARTTNRRPNKSLQIQRILRLYYATVGAIAHD